MAALQGKTVGAPPRRGQPPEPPPAPLRVTSSDGLPILVALIVSFLASLAVAVIVWLFDGFEILVWVLLFTVPYHAGLGGLLIWRLQSLATRAKAADDANSQRIADMFKKPSKPQS